jgi:hypothetical protein
MPPAAKLTFLALYAKESDVPLPANDSDIVAALDAYNAKYSKGSSKRFKDQLAETLTSLSWLHLNTQMFPRHVAASRSHNSSRLRLLSASITRLSPPIAIASYSREHNCRPRDARQHAHQTQRPGFERLFARSQAGAATLPRLRRRPCGRASLARRVFSSLYAGATAQERKELSRLPRCRPATARLLPWAGGAPRAATRHARHLLRQR